MHGFFPLKMTGFKKRRFKTKIVERIGAISTGTSRTEIRPKNLPVGESIVGNRRSGTDPL